MLLLYTSHILPSAEFKAMKILNNSQSKYYQYIRVCVCSFLFFSLETRKKITNFLLSFLFLCVWNGMVSKKYDGTKKEMAHDKIKLGLIAVRKEIMFLIHKTNTHPYTRTPARAHTYKEINNTENPFTCRSICARFLRYSCFHRVWFCRFHQCQS